MASYQKVIILGAARSGTNILRDMLVQLPGVTTWDCDEINYIWRYGNARYPSDEFTHDMALPPMINYIQNKFDNIAEVSNSDVVIEKTCANSLRVGFVNRVIPDAKYIFLIRDGRDACASAVERWRGHAKLRYILKKARYVPLHDIAYYAMKFITNRLIQLVSKSKTLQTWGPSFDGMHNLRDMYSLDEICALQWKKCVENTERDLMAIPKDRVIRVRYEDFVTNPVLEYRRMAKFIGKNVPKKIEIMLKNSIYTSSLGKANVRGLAADTIKAHKLMGDTLKYYGYE